MPKSDTGVMDSHPPWL